jgi:hypothetical protein
MSLDCVILITDCSKLETIQTKSAALNYTTLVMACDYKYEDGLIRLNYLTLHLRSRHLRALFY